MKNVTKIIISIIAVVIILIGYSYYPRQHVNKAAADTANVDFSKLNKIVFDVKTAKVIRGTLIKRISANGIVKANKEIDVVSKIGGIIKKIYVHEGKHVKKGDLLVKLDDKQYRIAVKEAQDKLTSAEVELVFVKKFSLIAPKINKIQAEKIKKEIDSLNRRFAIGAVSEKEYKNLKSKLEMQLIFTGAKREDMLLNKSGFNSAVNNLDRAKLNLQNTEIRAPFNCVVGDFNLVEGELISSWTKLFKLFQIDSLKIDVGILEDEIDKVHIGNSALVQINALDNKMFKGKVIAISPYVDTKTKTSRVTVLILNKNNRIKPGMFAKVNIEVEKLKNKILIPRSALLVRENRTLVFTVVDSLAKWKYVKIGEQNEKYIEVLSGVNPGDDVIVQGQFNLAHDSRVKIINQQ
jgi:RND family efflux transporter MFP subunit